MFRFTGTGRQRSHNAADWQQLLTQEMAKHHIHGRGLSDRGRFAFQRLIEHNHQTRINQALDKASVLSEYRCLFNYRRAERSRQYLRRLLPGYPYLR